MTGVTERPKERTSCGLSIERVAQQSGEAPPPEVTPIARTVGMATMGGIDVTRRNNVVVTGHSTSAVSGAAMEEAVAHWNRVGTPSMTLRTPEQISGFFDGLDLVPPGVVSCSRWRPEPGELPGTPAEVDEFCGVARKS